MSDHLVPDPRVAASPAPGLSALGALETDLMAFYAPPAEVARERGLDADFHDSLGRLRTAAVLRRAIKRSGFLYVWARKLLSAVRGRRR
jgi:hypothetical protein